jgi:hypothetical protein
MQHTKRMRQTPAGDDTPVMAMMRELGIPLTRKNYLEVNYLGCPPAELGPEEEIPELFQ